MALMSTCVARLGSRFSMILDPIRRQVHYGSLGLMVQKIGEMVVGLDNGEGTFCALPFTKIGQSFDMVDQRQTMTSVVFDARSTTLGLALHVELVAPFWPQDEKTSIVPAYIFKFRISRLDRLRWTNALPSASRKGVLRFGITSPYGMFAADPSGGLTMIYPVSVGGQAVTGEGGGVQIEFGKSSRTTGVNGVSVDQIHPLVGIWQAKGECLEAAYDLSVGAEQEFSLAVMCHVSDALLESHGRPMKLKYAKYWPTPAELTDYVRANHEKLCRKAARFDALWTESSLPAAAGDLSAVAFQSYLMCSLWATGADGEDWFSVWEGSCWYNSTVDVTYNEAMLYFACWPELLEMIFEEWSHHGNDADKEARRLEIASGRSHAPEKFPGLVLEHDMGSGWTANGQSYHHAMPVEENSNFLLLLYTHGKWWGRETMYAHYNELNKSLVEYLFWTDSTGNGFPDRGTANTIDDATPAVQYGRDNVYLGIKRLAALHAAGRMFEHTGEAALAARCRKEVARAVKTLNAGWLGDHWGVCLDKSAKGLKDCWTGKPLPYKILPGWDAYSLYTTNGLLPLMMVDDVPPGISADRLRQDVTNACRESMTLYGCGHSSLDKKNMWVSMNVWRDCAGGYLGENLLENCQRYWNQQLFANGPGSEKPNCFTETSLTNNLVWYPRGAAAFGLPLALPRLVRHGSRASISPIAPGRWPLLSLANWKSGKIPVAVVERKNGKLVAKVEGDTGTVRVIIKKAQG